VLGLGRRTADVGAVVATDTVLAAALVPFKLTEPGLTVQVAWEGAPVQVKLTAPVSPPWGEMLRL